MLGKAYITIVNVNDGSIGPIGPQGPEGTNTLPDWLTEWESNKTEINDEYIISPKIFTGKNEGTPSAPNITGVALGSDIFGAKGDLGNLNGIFGFKNNKITFQIQSDGKSKIGGWNFDNDSLYSKNKELPGDFAEGITFSSNGYFISPNFRIDPDGEAFFKGTINAISGNIGVFKIDTSDNKGDIVGYDSNGERLRLSTKPIPTLFELQSMSSEQFIQPITGNTVSKVLSIAPYNGAYEEDIAETQYVFNVSPDFIGKYISISYIISDEIILQEQGTNAQVNNSFSLKYAGNTISFIKESESSIKFYVEQPGEYTIVMTSVLSGYGDIWDDYWQPMGQVKARVHLELERISYLISDIKRTVLGSNGLYSMWNNNDYFFFRENTGFEVRFGAYGLKVNTTGIYKLKDTNWVPM